MRSWYSVTEDATLSYCLVQQPSWYILHLLFFSFVEKAVFLLNGICFLLWWFYITFITKVKNTIKNADVESFFSGCSKLSIFVLIFHIRNYSDALVHDCAYGIGPWLLPFWTICLQYWVSMRCRLLSRTFLSLLKRSL